MVSEPTSGKIQAAPTLDVIIEKLAYILRQQEELAFSTTQKLTSIKEPSDLGLIEDKEMKEPSDNFYSRALFIVGRLEIVTDRQVKNLDHLSEIV